MFSFPVKHNVLLAPYTTFKIGGPADYFFNAQNIESLVVILKEARQNNIPIFILGNGSNILVSDNGFRGLVVKIEASEIKVAENLVEAQAGATLGSLLAKCKENKLSGLEFLSGIPATCGGAVWSNCGSKDQSVGQFVKSVDILDEDLEKQTIVQAACRFSYRSSIFQSQESIILSMMFSLIPSDTESIAKKMQKAVEKKVANQDLAYPNAGSIFKNPETKKAWELIEEVDMRGFKIGGAQVSKKHANFIINTGQATASDVIMLISLIKQKVRDNLGVQLQEEIRYIGF